MCCVVFLSWVFSSVRSIKHQWHVNHFLWAECIPLLHPHTLNIVYKTSSVFRFRLSHLNGLSPALISLFHHLLNHKGLKLWWLISVKSNLRIQSLQQTYRAIVLTIQIIFHSKKCIHLVDQDNIPCDFCRDNGVSYTHPNIISKPHQWRIIYIRKCTPVSFPSPPYCEPLGHALDYPVTSSVCNKLPLLCPSECSFNI